jgi:hypothetical protein
MKANLFLVVTAKQWFRHQNGNDNIIGTLGSNKDIKLPERW